MNFIDPLTKREKDVFGLLVEGKTNRQIAKQLQLGIRTIDYHVANILSKTGLRNRTQVTSKYHESIQRNTTTIPA